MRKQISHILGRYIRSLRRSISLRIQRYSKTVDETIPDYIWWDRFRYGLQTGYELTGPLAASLVRILTSYILGRGMEISLQTVDDGRMTKKVEYTNDVLRRFSLAYQWFMIRLVNDWLSLGDQYVIVNHDGTLTVAPPHVCDIEYKKFEPTVPESYKFTTKVDDVEIEDAYYEDKRVVTIRYFDEVSKKTIERSETFANMLGRIPVVEFNYDRDSNSLKGKPIFFALRKMFQELEDLTNKSFQGAKIAANPIPTFEGLDNPEETIELNSSIEDEEFDDVDGNEETRRLINFDENPTLFLGLGGSFKFAGPAVGFSEDIERVIDKAFSWIRHYMQTPRVLLGGTDDLSEADAEGQIPSWIRYVELQRDQLGGLASDEKLGSEASNLHLLAELFLKARSLVDPKIFVGPTLIKWYDLTEDDEVLQFEKTKWAHSRRQISDVESLHLLNLVDDEIAAIKEAREEDRGTEMMEEFDDESDLTEDNTPDERNNEGAKAPRMPASSGGGRTQ